MADKETIRPPQQVDFLPEVKQAGFRFLQQIAQWVNAAIARVVTLEAVAVTNGNSHDHSGGDGAQIAYSTLSGLPTYVNFVDRGDSSAADFIETALTTDDTWRELDLSAIVPTGAVAVAMRVSVNDGALESHIKLRKAGNSNAVNAMIVRTQVANIWNDGTGIVALNSARKIEYTGSNLSFTGIILSVRGWFI